MVSDEVANRANARHLLQTVARLHGDLLGLGLLSSVVGLDEDLADAVHAVANLRTKALELSQ